MDFNQDKCCLQGQLHLRLPARKSLQEKIDQLFIMFFLSFKSSAQDLPFWKWLPVWWLKSLPNGKASISARLMTQSKSLKRAGTNAYIQYIWQRADARLSLRGNEIAAVIVNHSELISVRLQNQSKPRFWFTTVCLWVTAKQMRTFLVIHWSKQLRGWMKRTQSEKFKFN